MSILNVIAKETGGIRQYSDQYQIRSNGSHTVHTVQERPFTPDNCPRLADHDNYTLDWNDCGIPAECREEVWRLAFWDMAESDIEHGTMNNDVYHFYDE